MSPAALVSFKLESGDRVSKFGNGRGVVIWVMGQCGLPSRASAFSQAQRCCAFIVVGVVAEDPNVVDVLIAVGRSVIFLADAVSGAWNGIVYEGRCVIRFAELSGAAVAPWDALFVGGGLSMDVRAVWCLCFCCGAVTFGG